jgi:phosphotriesterase-related protein
MTVTGPVNPAQIGPTLMHEHVFRDLTATFAPVDDPELARYRDAPVSDETLDLLRIWPVQSDGTQRPSRRRTPGDGGAGAVRRVGWIAPRRLQNGRHRPRPRRAPGGRREDGRTDRAGNPFYVELTHPPFAAEASFEELAERVVQELTVGIGETGVRAGIIGEIGTSGIDRESPEARRCDTR